MGKVEYKPFQQASIDAICKYLEDNNRALCADEAGLGKTFIARGVIEKLAKRKIGEYEVDKYKEALMCWCKDFFTNEEIINTAPQFQGGGSIYKYKTVQNFVRLILQDDKWEKNNDLRWKDVPQECGVLDCINRINNVDSLVNILNIIIDLYCFLQDSNVTIKSRGEKNVGISTQLNFLKEFQPFRILYVCCNLAIAEQNTKKLVPIKQRSNVSSKDKPDRLSVIWYYLDNYPTPYMEIFPITATISKTATVGNENEKRILMGDSKAAIPPEKREEAEKISLLKLNPDLIIFDEFQNYSDMIHLIDMDDDAFKMYLQSLRDEKNDKDMDNGDDKAKHKEDEDDSLENRINSLVRCRKICQHFKDNKMLFLSATPFHKIELKESNINQFDIKGLLEFFKPNSFTEFEKALKSNETDKIERIMYERCGIFRNERIRLMKKNNMAYHIIECSGEGSLERAIENGNNTGNRAMGIISTTPDFSDVNEVYNTVYSIGRMSRNGLYKPWNIPHSRYVRLKDIIFSSDADNVTEKDCRVNISIEDMKKLLWIPPVSSRDCLGGVFARYREFSKSIIFSSMLVTPYSVCKKLNEEIGVNTLELNNREQDEIIKWLTDNVFFIYDKKEDIAKKFVTDYLQKNGGSLWMNEPDKTKVIIDYCKDGALVDVIREYAELGFSDDDLLDLFGTGYSSFAYAMKKIDLDKSTAGVSIRKNFNSPFYPFVLMTTSIGSEGLDFHLYCNRLVHYTLPTSVTQLEQKNGRIDRKNSLAQRRWWAKLQNQYILQNYGKELEKSSGGLIPDWDAGEGNLHYFFMYTRFTSEKEKIEELLNEKSVYRSSIGADMTVNDKEINLCPYIRENKCNG